MISQDERRERDEAKAAISRAIQEAGEDVPQRGHHLINAVLEALGLDGKLSYVRALTLTADCRGVPVLTIEKYVTAGEGKRLTAALEQLRAVVVQKDDPQPDHVTEAAP